MKKIRIQRVSAFSIVTGIILCIAFVVISFWGWKEFNILQQVTEQYILCESAAKEVQDGSDYLTEQARLYALTGEQKYLDLYFEEATVTKRREKAVEALHAEFAETDTYKSLVKALESSYDLMKAEYHSMRLVAVANGIDKETLPEKVQEVVLSENELAMSKSELLEKAQVLVSNDAYQNMRNNITRHTDECMQTLLTDTRNKQSRAKDIYEDIFKKMEIFVFVMIFLVLLLCFTIRHLIVIPLIHYNESIKKGEIFPLEGSSELQSLAENYNEVYRENEEAQKIIRHEAEYDALTELLNRRYFDKVLNIYETGNNQFALIIVDVDIFKEVNDTYGHAIGDKILQKVANTLKHSFRNIDYICRIGGDEFAIVMVEMTSDLGYTIKDKIAYCNETLSNPTDDLPSISLSVGVAFADRKNPGESIFKDADKALYYTKEHGKKGCNIYGEINEAEINEC